MANSATQFVPPPVPRDTEGYVKAFTLSHGNHQEVQEAREFFDKFGFVVVANVFTPEQCADTVSDIWNVIESFAQLPLRNDEELWTEQNWKNTGFVDKGIICTSSLWTRQILLNRQTSALHAAFAAILGTEKLLVNHDRYGMFRPAKDHPERETMTNLHLDMNPWSYLEDKDNHDQLNILTRLRYRNDNDWIIENNEPGCSAIEELHVQGLVNLVDNQEEDGGFWLIPGFHKYLTQWTREHKKLVNIYGRWDRFNLFTEYDMPELYAVACHISSRAGSAILWDQRTMHGSRANHSLRPRYAQFYKMFPVEHSTMTPERAKRRAEAILSKLKLVNIDPKMDLSPLGCRLFGLENWDQ